MIATNPPVDKNIMLIADNCRMLQATQSRGVDTRRQGVLTVEVLKSVRFERTSVCGVDQSGCAGGKIRMARPS